MQRQYYLWTAGGSTVSVSLGADVIIRLRDAIAAAREQEELGGILLGRCDSGETISIESYEIVSSEHRRGMTFSLSGSDKRRLWQRLRASHHGLQPVGSFRTHLRQGLYMDQYDFDLMQEYFRASTDVMLLVRPDDGQAGFFVWEEGDISRQKSYRQFPFDPQALPLTAPVANDAQPADVPQPADIVVARSKVSQRRTPTLVKVGFVAATAGLAAVLAFYTHEHRPPIAPHPSVLVANNTQQPQLSPVDPPVDPDTPNPISSASEHSGNELELHVKIPARPSPFDSEKLGRDIGLTSPKLHPHSLAQPATPPVPVQPVQTASITPPPAVAQTVLRPVRPTFVSEVSLEPSQPGVLRRGIHHVPVLKLFDRHDYKSGTGFAPARPVREVKPRLPEDVQQEGPQHPDVAVKVWINDEGQVTKAELLSDHVDPEIADVASNAAYKWAFEPARLSDRPVSSEMVMHFRFVPKQSY